MIFFMPIGTWMLTSISPREWVAVHRKHHNFTDVEGDPHSPHIEGYWKIMLANVYYRREANNDGTLQKYASDLPHELVEALRLAKVTSKVDEGWDKHRRRIPPMAACSASAPATAQPKSG